MVLIASEARFSNSCQSKEPAAGSLGITNQPKRLAAELQIAFVHESERHG